MDADAVNLGLLVIRVVVGVTLALHGIAKYKGGIKGVGGWFESEGLRPGIVHAHLAGLTEIGAGFGLALGFLTPLSAMAYIGVMAVAGWIGHRKNGFFIIKQGWEYTFVLGGTAAGIAATGPGEWSLDNAMGVDWNGIPWFIAAVGGGLGAAVGLLGLFYRPKA
ncbi:MAG: putative oxidoreductase [Candidatus Poriferisodalaceae bacterium]|jgi:putative oxidoreductase